LRRMLTLLTWWFVASYVYLDGSCNTVYVRHLDESPACVADIETYCPGGGSCQASADRPLLLAYYSPTCAQLDREESREVGRATKTP
jgi:hypothetical protein